MAEQMTIIFPAGAWHSEMHVKPIRPYLEQLGYRVVPIKLWTSEKHDPLPVMRDNVDQVRGAIRAEVEAGHKFCVLGHSVSGLPVAAAVSEFLDSCAEAEKAHLVHVMYIACFWDPVRTLSEQDWYEIDMETMWATIVKPAEDIFYNDMPREEAKPYVDALDANRAQMPPDMSDSWKTKMKPTYFYCNKDKAVLPKYQKMEAEENNLAVVELDMDHCPMVSRPKELAEQIDQVLKGKK